MNTVINGVTYTDMDQWFDLYKPVKNPYDQGNGFNDCIFHFGGREMEHVLKIFEKNPRRVWTVLQVDGVFVVTQGLHYVNREGYLITRRYWKEGEDWNIYYDDDIARMKRQAEREVEYTPERVIPTPTAGLVPHVYGDHRDEVHDGLLAYNPDEKGYVLLDMDKEMIWNEVYDTAQEAVDHAFTGLHVNITNTEIFDWTEYEDD